MNKAMEKYRQFMYNRNGFDKLMVALLLIYLLLNGISSMIPQPIVHYVLKGVAALVAIFALYRFFSKNLYRRQYEETKFENLIDKTNYRENFFRIKKKFRQTKIRFQQIKTHRFRTCPQCGENLRISKKRGKRNITCPKCGKQFNVHIIF